MVKMITITVPHQYDGEDIVDIMVGAIEGGINYWGFIGAATKKGKPQDVPTSEWCANKLMDGHSVVIVDNEDKDEKFELTLDKLQKGLQMHVAKGGNYQVDQMDAGDYDCIIQLALFDKVVYG